MQSSSSNHFKIDPFSSSSSSSSSGHNYFRIDPFSSSGSGSGSSSSSGGFSSYNYFTASSYINIPSPVSFQPNQSGVFTADQSNRNEFEKWIKEKEKIDNEIKAKLEAAFKPFKKIDTKTVKENSEFKKLVTEFEGKEERTSNEIKAKSEAAFEAFKEIDTKTVKENSDSFTSKDKTFSFKVHLPIQLEESIKKLKESLPIEISPKIPKKVSSSNPTEDETSFWHSTSKVVRCKTSWLEKWEKSHSVVEENDQYDLHKLDRNFGSVVIGAGIGVVDHAIELAGDMAAAAVNLSMTVNQFEQAYNPDHTKDLYSPQNEQLTAEVDRIIEKGNTILHTVADDPKATGKAILQGVNAYVKEGLADITEKHRQGDYLGAGRTIGKLGLDAYLVAAGVQSVSIEALNLAVATGKVVSNVAKVVGKSALGVLTESIEVAAPRNSLLAFQYQSQLKAGLLAEREANRAAKVATKVANIAAQKELRIAAQARRSAVASSSMAQASSSGSSVAQALSSTEVFVQPTVIPKQYVGLSSTSVPVDSSVSLESLRSPAIREKFGIDGIMEAPKFGGLWTKKDLLSRKGLLEPVPLVMAEKELVIQWAFVRKAELEKLSRINTDNINSPLLRKVLKASKEQLLDHMTPDDLAAIIKESKGFKILKEDGTAFNHIGEWRDAKTSFKNLFDGGKESKMFSKLTEQEFQIWENQVGNISDLWDQYDCFIEKARHLNKFKPVLKG